MNQYLRQTFIAIFTVAILALASLAADERTSEYRGGSVRLRLAFAPYARSRSSACILLQQFGAGQGYGRVTEPDPTTIALLQRIADQQAAMATQFQIMAATQQQQRTPTTDPALIAAITQLSGQISSHQDRVLAAIESGRIADRENTDRLRQMIADQNQLFATLQRLPAPSPATPPPSPGPSVIILPPSGGAGGGVPGAGGVLQPLPPSAAMQALPGPGGSLQLIPPAGGTLQAVPGPGGSLQILPGGVKPPTPGTPTLPGIEPMTPLPGLGTPLQAFKVRSTSIYRR